MILGTHNEIKAIEMRRTGLSISDISKELRVSRTSVSNWLKNTKLTESEKLLLKKTIETKMQRARMKASISLRSRALYRDRKAFEIADGEFKKYIKDPFFTLGLGFYMAKGSMVGGNIQFSHSNPEIIKIIVAWFGKYLNLPKESLKYRLFIDLSQKSDELKAFWSSSLLIPLENFQKTIHKAGGKNRKNMNNYKGSLSTISTRIDVLRKIIAWQKLLIGYYS